MENVQYSRDRSISQIDFNSRIGSVYKYVGLSVLMAAFGSYMGMENIALLQGMMFWGFVILEFVFLIALFILKEKEGLNLFLLFGFTFLSGFTIAPILSLTLGLANGATILTNALLATSVAVGAISLYAINTKRDFSGIGKYLFVALIVLIVVGIVNMFMQSSMLHMVISAVSGILFSFYLIYDTQNIVNNRFDHPMTAAVGVYIDILNIFLSILNLMLAFSGERD
jgi:modulator of FtsH protease